MNCDHKVEAAVLVAILMFCCIGAGIGYMVATADFRADLIQRGLAEYCATDGRFAFKGECE